MNNNPNNTQGTKQVVTQQLQKNHAAIHTLKSELLRLESKISDGEKRLEESKEIMRRYQEVTKRILDLNNKLKQNPNVSQKIKSSFEELISQAEVLEDDLAKRGIRSVEDLNKLNQITRDNRNMVSKYTDMVSNLEKQNEYYKTVALNNIAENTKNAGREIKQIITELSKNYGVTISNFEQMNDEIHKTEQQIKNLVIRKSIANEQNNDLRKFEEAINRYNKCKKDLASLKNKMFDETGKIKNPEMQQKFIRSKESLEKQMKQDFEYLKENNLSGHKDFIEKDNLNKEEIEKIETALDLANKKLGLLQEIKNEIRRKTQKST